MAQKMAPYSTWDSTGWETGVRGKNWAPTGTPYKITTKNKHKPPAPKPHLFTYSSPVFSLSSASFYGLTIPVSLGQRAIVGVPIFTSPLKTEGTQQYIDMAVSLGYQGAQFADIVATNVSKIWADETLVYDASKTDGWNTAAGIKFKLYPGTEDQMPDPVITSWLGADLGIAFRGEIYIMFYDFPLTKYGLQHVPVIRAEIKDTYTTNNDIWDVARIGGDVPISELTQQVAMDWNRRRLYLFDSAARTVNCYDMLNMVELFRFSTTGIDSDGLIPGDISPFPGGFYCSPRFGYLITNEGASNSSTIFCLDPNTGNIIGQWGIDSGAISNTDQNFVNQTDFCEMTQDDTTGDSFIMSIGIFFGGIGILRLSPDGELNYAWTPGDVNTLFDVFSIIGEGAVNSVHRWCCPGDVVRTSVPGTSNAATALVASYFEICRVVLTPDPGGAVSGGSHGVGATGSSGYQARHDLLWRPPLGHYINWVFRDEETDADFVVLHRSSWYNEMFFSRIRIDSNLANKANPDPGTSGSEIGYATTLWMGGPIPRIPDTSLLATTGGAVSDSQDVDRYNGFQFSKFGSTNTLGYHNGDNVTAGDRHITVLNVQDGTWGTYDISNQAYIDGEAAGPTSGVQFSTCQIWDGDSSSFIGWSFPTSATGEDFGPARVHPFIATTATGIPLYTILDWLMQYAGFDDDDLGISNSLSDTFTGALVQEVGLSLWEMLDDMSKALQFEVFESEGKVKMTKVGRGASLTITYTLDPDDDLMAVNASDGEGKGSNDSPQGEASAYTGFTTERDWNRDAPQTIELHYLDQTQSYTVNLARANRTTFPVSTTENDTVERLDVPIIMSPQKAFKYAAMALYNAYQGQVNHEMRLGSKYVRMEPGDVLFLTINDMDYVMKVTEATINADWSMSVLAESFSNVETVSITGEETLKNDQVVNGPSISQGFIVDTPPLVPEDCSSITDDALRIYEEVTSYGQAGWRGAHILFSTVAAGPYDEVWRDTVTGGSFVGVAVSGISGGLASTTDLLTTLDVNFTVMPTALTGSSGYMLLGKQGRWEFLYYGSAVAGTGSSRNYQFTGLIRGLRGTEWHMDDHQGGDTVLLYPNIDHLALEPLDISLISGTIYYKACGINEDDETFPPQSFTMLQNFEKPWAPTSLKALTISGGSSGLTLSWLRRTRLDYGVPWGTGGLAQPLEPGWTEQYEIEILGATGNVLRTVTGALTNSYTYASGDVTTDFGSRPATISFNVYQISPVVGRGFPGSITTDVVSVT